MLAVLNKEIQSFFSSSIGYLVIGLFLVACGFFLFIFNGDYNILNSGFADLKAFFDLAPWIFIFLIPAVGMKSFAEEKRMGTMELLLTKPISLWQLLLGKYFGILILVIIAITPSFLYVWTIYELGNTIGNLDWGATIGSYLGLLFLSGCYSAISVFASSLSGNQIVAFIIGVFLCFFCYFGFEGLAGTQLFGNSTSILEAFGINFHYRSISRGVIDTRDVVYFLSFILLFLLITHLYLSTSKSKN